MYAKGVNASPGAAVGQVYFDADTAENMAKEQKQDVIMVRPFTKPDDVHGMLAAKGILTSEGGATSHAAVVARQFGVPCVVGAAEIRIDLEKRQMVANGKVVKEGDGFLSTAPVARSSSAKSRPLHPTWKSRPTCSPCSSGRMKSAPPRASAPRPHGWPTKGLQVWANADYPADARRARAYGAVGIGLCRTEHMFFEPQRLPIVQRMILAETSAERTAALNELLPYQRSDFAGLFECHGWLPGHHPPDRPAAA